MTALIDGRNPIPLTVIGGFLGTGKTTLLNRVLHEPHGVSYAVLVNDFGTINIDMALTSDHAGKTVSFANGCVCCSLGDNLVDTIDELIHSASPPDQFLVEASGVADPRNIADVATLHPDLRRDLTVITADASTVLDRMTDTRLTDTVQRQLSSADVIVLNKCDLVAQVTATATIDQIKTVTQAAIVKATYADIPLDVLSAVPITQTDDLSMPTKRRGHRDHQLGQFSTVTLQLIMPISATRLAAIFNDLQPTLLRSKGFIQNLDDQNSSTLIQFSGSRLETTRLDNSAPTPSYDLVLIGAGELPTAAQLSDALYDAANFTKSS